MEEKLSYKLVIYHIVHNYAPTSTLQDKDSNHNRPAEVIRLSCVGLIQYFESVIYEKVSKTEGPYSGAPFIRTHLCMFPNWHKQIWTLVLCNNLLMVGFDL